MARRTLDQQPILGEIEDVFDAPLLSMATENSKFPMELPIQKTLTLSLVERLILPRLVASRSAVLPIPMKRRELHATMAIAALPRFMLSVHF